jgi:hypothetical protein
MLVSLLFSFATHLLWALVVLYVTHRVCLLVRPSSWRKDETPVQEEIPEDLVALAMQENEAWAQEELLRVMRERYEELRDWNKVRSAVGIGRIDG